MNSTLFNNTGSGNNLPYPTFSQFLILQTPLKCIRPKIEKSLLTCSSFACSQYSNVNNKKQKVVCAVFGEFSEETAKNTVVLMLMWFTFFRQVTLSRSAVCCSEKPGLGMWYIRCRETKHLAAYSFILWLVSGLWCISSRAQVFCVLSVSPTSQCSGAF